MRKFELQLIVPGDKISTILEVLDGECEVTAPIKPITNAAVRLAHRKGYVHQKYPRPVLDIMYDFLKDKGTITYKQIVAGTGMPEGTVGSALAKLRKLGKVDCVAKGVWRTLPSSPPALVRAGP